NGREGRGECDRRAARVKPLLDTCTFLWFIRDDASLSSRARTIVRDTGNDVYLSAASAWEIAIKHALGRLPLPSPPHVFVPRQRENHQIDRLEIGEESALLAPPRGEQAHARNEPARRRNFHRSFLFA
ncbi:MAG: type II toxin-antitoxin system VapC family toxin, partial [Spirochaetia bacterium]